MLLLQGVQGAEPGHRERPDGLDRRRLRRAPARRALEQDRGQEPGDAEAEDVDGDTGDDVVDAEGDGGDRVHEAAHRAEGDARDQAGPGPVLPTDPPGPERAEDHHALEPDVDDSGAFRPEAAETGHGDRHGSAQGGPDRAARGERVRTGDHPDDGEQQDAGADGGQDRAPVPEPTVPQRRRLDLGVDGAVVGEAHDWAPSATAAVSGGVAASARATSRCSATIRYRRTSS